MKHRTSFSFPVVNLHAQLSSLTWFKSVADINESVSTWFKSAISYVLPEENSKNIKAIPFSFNPNSEDTTCWALSKDGSFSLISACIIAKGFNPLNLSPSPHKWI